jgi:hypothetical protein
MIHEVVGEGSRPSPQSPIGILGFPSPDQAMHGTPGTKAKLLNSVSFYSGTAVKSPCL